MGRYAVKFSVWKPSGGIEKVTEIVSSEGKDRAVVEARRRLKEKGIEDAALDASVYLGSDKDLGKSG